MSSCKSSIMRGTCADCEPRSSSSNDPTSRELPIPSPQSPCFFCRLVGKVFEYYFGDVSAKYRYGTDYDCFDELYLHFRDVDGHRHYVQVYINDMETPQHHAAIGRHVSLYPAADEAIQKMKQWIDKCVLEHDDCAVGAIRGDPLHAVVPKRLIKLGDSPSTYVQLVSLGKPVQYSALSYCWGTSSQQGTTKNNLALRRDAICTAELPKTLRDAILVTQKLGLEYVWIDSLCIIQDDEQDWVEESSKMADIYTGAHVVIAATRSSDCADGFLQTHETPFRTNQSDIQSTGYEAFARRTTTHDLSGQFILDTQPLYKRAWAMQERELARRVIHFVPDEIVWRCRTTITCECSPLQEPKPAASRVRELRQTDLGNDSEDLSCAFGKRWTSLVQKYLKFKLSHSSDRLPALSGIVKCVQQMDPGRYIVGMWERDIIYQLAWFHDREYEPGHYIEPHSTRPTFSWNAFPSPVLWPSIDTGIVRRCEFISSTATPTSSNPYGPARDCSITVRGPLLQGSKVLTHIISGKSTIEPQISWDRITPLESSGMRKESLESGPQTFETS